MPTKIHWTKEQLAHIEQRFAAGALRAKVAEELGVSRDTIEKVVRKYGMVAGRRQKAPSPVMERIGLGGAPLPAGHPLALAILRGE